MKKIALFAIISFFNLQFSIAHAQQYTQQVPDQVSEIRLEDYASLIVKSTDGPMMLQTYNKNQVATVKFDRMTIPASSTALTLLLPPGRSITFVAEDYSNISFVGSFGKRQQLTVHTEDHARALFSGSLADSVWAVNLTLQAEDYSQIHSNVRMVNYNFAFLPDDYARITVDCVQSKHEPGVGPRKQTVAVCDHCLVNWNYCPSDTVYNVGQDTAYAQSVQGRKMHAMQKRDSIKYEVRHPRFPSEPEGNAKKRSIWRSRDVALNFAWGFHNWGTDRFNGFQGIDGDAAVRTSFNNLQLSVDYPLVGTRHFGFYVGLGLEWDKYKFEGHEITFSSPLSTFNFQDGGDAACTSWLNTRYVELPLTFRFDLWHDWSLTLSAIPGIHWGGSHTGLRREYNTDLEQRIDYDYSVNRYINPYKLDLRATLNYEGIGLYVQVPTLSTMRDNTQPLYPIKFGIILTQD